MRSKLCLPAIAVTFLQLTRGLRASHTACRILATAAKVSVRSSRFYFQTTHPIPIPSKNRYAVSAAKSPYVLPPAPYDPALNAANTNRMMVDTSKLHFLE